MLFLILLLFLFITPMVLITIHHFRPRSGFFWLISAVSAFLTWLIFIYLRIDLPGDIILTNFGFQENNTLTTSLKIDPISWSIAFSMVSFHMVGVFTDVVRRSEADWSTWARGIALTGLSVLSIFAGNPLTMLLAWVLIDFTEIVMLLGQGYRGEDSRPIIVIFTLRLAGSILVLAATILAVSMQSQLTFDKIPPEIGGYLLLGAGLRIIVLPLYPSLIRNMTIRRTLDTLVRYLPVTTSLVLVVRVAQMGIVKNWENYLLLLVDLVILISAFRWLSAIDEISGRRYWLLGISCLAFAAAIVGQVAASLVWILVMVMVGGTLFLASIRTRSLRIIFVFSGLTLLMLPYTPTWNGIFLFEPPFRILYFPLLIAQASFLAGYFRFSLQEIKANTPPERREWMIYILGLLSLTILSFGISFTNQTLLSGPEWNQSWTTLFLLGLLSLFVLVETRKIRFPITSSIQIPIHIPAQWIYPFLSWFHLQLGRLANFISQIMEGEGGILWTLLLFLLLISVFIFTVTSR